MRVYHFVNEAFGLQDLQRQRIKVAKFLELNDPFELFWPCFSDPDTRLTWRNIASEIADTLGIICFSKDWHNPVQWSHYADRHRGFCMGFDIPDELLNHVRYKAKRIEPNFLRLIFHQEYEEEFKRYVLCTKFSHWRYEQEVRRIVLLQDHMLEDDIYFARFSEQLVLREVIVGALCKASRSSVLDALGNLGSNVTCRKARLAFRTFRVVEQREASLWE